MAKRRSVLKRIRKVAPFIAVGGAAAIAGSELASRAQKRVKLRAQKQIKKSAERAVEKTEALFQPRTDRATEQEIEQKVMQKTAVAADAGGFLNTKIFGIPVLVVGVLALILFFVLK